MSQRSTDFANTVIAGSTNKNEHICLDDMIENTDTVCSITKQCIKCEQTKPLTEFYITPKTKRGYRGDGWRNVCKLCWAIGAQQYRRTTQGKKKINEASKRFWKSKNGELARKRYYHSKAYKVHRLAKYNMTIAEYDKIFEEQQGNCAICGLPEIMRRLSIDHNHKTGDVRALLCNHCNFLVGIIEGKMELLRKAVDYLNKYNVNKVEHSIRS